MNLSHFEAVEREARLDKQAAEEARVEKYGDPIELSFERTKEPAVTLEQLADAVLLGVTDDGKGGHFLGCYGMTPGKLVALARRAKREAENG